MISSYDFYQRLEDIKFCENVNLFHLPEPTYKELVEAAVFLNSPTEKRIRELRNRIRNHRKKSKKVKKWISEYHFLKSCRFSEFYSRPSQVIKNN